jgi:hypothetical protein
MGYWMQKNYFTHLLVIQFSARWKEPCIVKLIYNCVMYGLIQCTFFVNFLVHL